MRQRKLIWQLYPSYLVVTLVAIIAVAAYCSGFFRQVYDHQVRDALDQLAGVASEQVRMVLRPRAQIAWTAYASGLPVAANIERD